MIQRESVSRGSHGAVVRDASQRHIDGQQAALDEPLVGAERLPAHVHAARAGGERGCDLSAAHAGAPLVHARRGA